jgi:type IV pilus assembly protein PilN
MKVRLNIATSPLESNRRFIVGAVAIGSLALLALVLLSRQAYTEWSGDKAFRTRQAAYERQIGSLQQQRQSLADYFNNSDTVKRRQRSAYLNGLIQQRAFPWIKIFMDLEQILPEGVRVVSIEPKLDGDNVQLQFLVGATSDDSKLKFLKALETSAEFSNIQLLSETRPNRPELTDRVMLALQARYSVI